MAMLVVLFSLQVGVTSCKKETIYDTVTLIKKDTTIIIAKDTVPVVNAGADTTINLSSVSDSIKLVGSASDAYDPIVSYLWSQVSGPNTSLISNPGSATTFVNNLVGGTYVFQLMATDNDGETGVKKVTVKIIPPQIYTVSLQPDNNPNEVLLGYLNSSGDITNPNSPELIAETWTVGGSPVTLRGLFKFDFGALPSNARVLSAKLSLYSDPTPSNGDLVHANSGSDNSMLLQRVTSNWDNSVKWQTQPSVDASTQIIIPATSQSFLDVTDLDVSDMIKDMVQSGDYGFMIKLQNEVTYNTRIFASSKYSDASKHPKLVIQYSK